MSLSEQKKSGDDKSCYTVGSLTCTLQVLAIPSLDIQVFFKCHVTVLVHGVHLINITYEELLFQSSRTSSRGKKSLALNW